MTKTQLVKFIKESKSEIHSGLDGLFLMVYFWELKTFCEILPEFAFEDGLADCLRLQKDYLIINITDVCNCSGININEVIEEVENEL